MSEVQNHDAAGYHDTARQRVEKVCTRVRRARAASGDKPRQRHFHAAAGGGEPSATAYGLTPQSLNDYYSAEWGRYVQFVSQRGAQVPGRDVQWNMTLVWEYLRHRALTCKPETVKVKQILTKLVHFARRSF